MPAPDWIRRAGNAANQNSTTILSGVAIGGVIVTAILSAKAMDKARYEFAGVEEQTGTKTPVKTLVKECWRYFVPPVVAGSITIAAIGTANKIGLSRNAAMLGAFTLVDTAFRNYKDEVLAQIGENKEEKVRAAIMQKKIDENPPQTSQVIITSGGDQLCFDSLTGRYFKSDVEKIRRAENDVNALILNGNYYASVDELYEYLELGPTAIGNRLGWRMDNLVDIKFTSHLSPEGVPAIAIEHKNFPRPDYTDFE